MARAQRPKVYTEPLQIKVTPEMLAALHHERDERNCSVADLVRESLDLTAGLAPDLITSIERQAAELGVPVATLVREAVEDYARTGWGVD